MQPRCCHGRHPAPPVCKQMLYLPLKKHFSYILYMLWYLSMLLQLLQASFQTLSHVNGTVGKDGSPMFALVRLIEHCTGCSHAAAKDKHGGSSCTLCFLMKHVTVAGSRSSTPRRRTKERACVWHPLHRLSFLFCQKPHCVLLPGAF